MGLIVSCLHMNSSKFVHIFYQVFLLESQIGINGPRKMLENSTDDDDYKSYIFVLSLNESKEKPEAAKTR